MKPLAIIAGLFFIVQSVIASETTQHGATTENYYRIEMMLVAYTNESLINHEHWDSGLALSAAPTEGSELSSTPIPAASLPQIPTGETLNWWQATSLPLALAGAESRIRQRPDMRVLWHHAWQENIQPSESALAHPFNIQLQGPLNIHLYGTISFSINRYLHINTDLIMQHSQRNPETSELLPLRMAHIQLSRRMRSNELHYLDHPLLGIVVKITPPAKNRP